VFGDKTVDMIADRLRTMVTQEFVLAVGQDAIAPIKTLRARAVGLWRWHGVLLSAS